MKYLVRIWLLENSHGQQLTEQGPCAADADRPWIHLGILLEL